MTKIITDKDKIEELLSRGTGEIIEKDHLKKRLLKGDMLRVKFGIDPTGSLLHFGHSLSLMKLQEFLELGHKAILLIGDVTATIGDPSGRLQERPPLSREEVDRNMRKYLDQAEKILDIKKVEIRYNSEWYDKKDTKFFMDLASKFTYSRLMDRAEFKERVKSGGDVTLMELIYPILQGYDSVELKADVEIGGTDQKFNLLMGRKVQRRYNVTEQDIITIPLLIGTDGERKMSKTYNNYIALSDSVDDMFAKIMSIPDVLIWQYFTLLTKVPLEDIKKWQEVSKGNILEKKKELALIITKRFHGEKNAVKAKDNFETTFQKHEIPKNIPLISVPGGKMEIVDFLVKNKIYSSTSDAKRVIQQGGIKIDGQIIDRWGEKLKVKDSSVLQVGPRRFYKLKVD